jgi:23S rRNA pseudouridine955/2504/2580 synthase
MSIPDKTTGVRQVEVDKDRAGQRIDNFLSARLKGLPRSAVYRMIRTGQVRINGKRCKPTSRLEEGDIVRIPPARTRDDGQAVISDRILQQVRAAILFENQDLLVIDKPSGMAVHSGSGLPWGLVDVVRRIYPDEYIELAHRLDRETSGCLVLARNGSTLGHLNTLFRDDLVQKRYLCLLDGKMAESLVEVDAPLQKVQDQAESRVVVSEEGKSALTRFRLLQAYSDSSYVEAELRSGRTHQIRVHAQSIGLPLAGDEKYSDPGSIQRWKNRGLRRLFLHAHRLAFAAPTGEELDFSASLPADLGGVLDELEPA